MTKVDIKGPLRTLLTCLKSELVCMQGVDYTPGSFEGRKLDTYHEELNLLLKNLDSTDRCCSTPTTPKRQIYTTSLEMCKMN